MSSVLVYNFFHSISLYIFLYFKLKPIKKLFITIIINFIIIIIVWKCSLLKEQITVKFFKHSISKYRLTTFHIFIITPLLEYIIRYDFIDLEGMQKFITYGILKILNEKPLKPLFFKNKSTSDSLLTF